MTPLATLGVLLAILAIVSVAVSFGLQVLRWIRVQPDSTLEAVLLAAGAGFLTLELFAFALATCAWFHRAQALALLAGMALVAGNGWTKLLGHLRILWNREAEICRTRKGMLASLALLAGVALTILTSMAPLTGSDAMHYHFTTALAAAGNRSPVRFDILPSFFTGEGHALIGLGLALGSDRIALGLICVGGLFTLAVVFLLAEGLTSLSWAWACALAFLLTPMVLWQSSVSGAPDIWMGFFTALAVLALSRAIRDKAIGWLALAGGFAGAVGGAKYTGWFVAVAIVLVCWGETRSTWRMFFCGCCALLTGFLPLLRNFLVGGDPFFPFVLERFGKHPLPAYTLAAIVGETRSRIFSRSIPHLLAFPFLVTLEGSKYGLGQLFGPLILAFAPLLVFLPWRKPLVRIAGLVCLTFFVADSLSNQMGRFLLPVYPLALVLSVAAAFHAGRKGWRSARIACAGVLAFFLLFSVGADLVYAKTFLPVAVGLERRQTFLDEMAPDYRVAEFINRELRGRQGKVMVFFHHLFYLRVPFVDGDPADSRFTGALVDQGPGEMLATLHKLDIRWVVKSPDFPSALAGAARKLEAEDVLRPVASSEVVDFSGDRIYRHRRKIRVVILQVEK